MIKKINAESESSKLAIKRLAGDLLATSPEIRGKDQSHLLDFLTEQALKGTDLHRAYPGAFQALMKDAGLREVFAELIDAVEQERAGELPELPVLNKINLGFLRTSHSPQVKPPGTSHWNVLIRRTAEELQNLFKPQELVFRSSANIADEDWLTLLREDLYLDENTSVAFILEMAHTSTPNELGLFTSIALNPSAGSADQEYLYDLKVSWGGYEGSAKLGESYRVALPPIQAKTVEDNLGQDLVAKLNIETVKNNED